MNIQQSTIDLIASFEGCSLKPYHDSGTKWAYGYGADYDLNGNAVTPSTPPLANVDQAKKLLGKQLIIYANEVKSAVKVAVTQNQFDVLCSFTYNLGAGSLLESDLLKNINAGHPVIEANFTDWGNKRINGKLVRDQGVYNRRVKEFQLFTA